MTPIELKDEERGLRSMLWSRNRSRLSEGFHQCAHGSVHGVISADLGNLAEMFA